MILDSIFLLIYKIMPETKFIVLSWQMFGESEQLKWLLAKLADLQYKKRVYYS